MVDESQLPDELQGQGRVAPAKRRPLSDEARQTRLTALGAVIAKKRDEAVKARRDSGIEEVWSYCEEAYLAMDDANRGEFSKAKWAKPMALQGPLTREASQQSSSKSTVFIPLTTRYVDMGAAKVSEIVLPIDDKAFSFEASPVSDLVSGPPKAPPAAPPVPPPALSGPGPMPQAMPPADPRDLAKQQAGAAAKKAENRIYDWMVESRYPMQMRKVIFDAARIGVGVLKGPFSETCTERAFTVEGNVGTLVIDTKVKPGCKWIDPWNFYPHGSCGEDIHEGDHVFERDFLSSASLTALKKERGLITDAFPGGEPIYLPEQIDKVIAEGPEKCNTNEDRPEMSEAEKSRFTIWHFTGSLDAEDMVALGAPGADELPAEVSEVYAIVTLVNDTPIRATFNPLGKSGNYPYRVFPWSRRAGHWAGVGVGEQVKVPQRVVNAGVRSWMNMAGVASGLQIFIDRRGVVPADNSWDITPNKLWYITGEGMSNDVRQLVMGINMPDIGETLFKIIDFAFKQAEELSNIPLVSQGQTGPQDPKTFGQSELQNNNAQTLLRDKAYMIDDCITEPLVGDFYEWLLLDDSVPNDEKGDFKINARGSIAMVEKAIQEQTFPMLIQAASQNPSYGQNPAKLFADWMRSKRFNPDLTKYTDAEMAALQSRQPPEAPVVSAAKINAATRLHVQDMADQTRLKTAAFDTNRDVAYEQALVERERIDAQFRLKELDLRKEVAMLEISAKQGISLNQIKAELAGVAMKLNTQRELSTDALAAELHMHHTPGASDLIPPTHQTQALTPPTEPVGQAQPGQAFTQ